MRSAARQPREEPAPERADLDAKATQALDGLTGLASGAQSLMARCPDPQTVALMRQLVTEVVATGRHLEELRGELARYAAANAGIDYAFEDGRAYEREQAAKAGIPGPRSHRRTSASRRPGEGQAALFSVPRLSGIAAFAALAHPGLQAAPEGLPASPARR